MWVSFEDVVMGPNLQPHDEKYSFFRLCMHVVRQDELTMAKRQS